MNKAKHEFKFKLFSLNFWLEISKNNKYSFLLLKCCDIFKISRRDIST